MKRDIFQKAVLLLFALMIIGFVPDTFASETENNIETIHPSLQLQKLEPNDIERIEIFEYSEKDKTKSIYPRQVPQKSIEGFIVMCKKATIWQQPGIRYSQHASDYLLSVKLVNGDVLEIPYSSSLLEPVGKLESLQLKEALYAITCRIDGCIIYFDKGNVIDVIQFRTGTGRSGCISTFNFNEKGQLILNLRMSRDKGKIVMEDSKPIRLGQAQVFDYDGEGYMIVHVYPKEF